MPNTEEPSNGFEALVARNEFLLRNLYYLNMKICDICIQAIDKHDRERPNEKAGRKLIESHYSRHAPIVEAVIGLLGYEPDFEECIRPMVRSELRGERHPANLRKISTLIRPLSRRLSARYSRTNVLARMVATLAPSPEFKVVGQVKHVWVSIKDWCA